MTFGWPQIITLGLILLSMGIVLAKHGEPKTGTVSFPSHCFNCALTLGLLYWGGFFG